MIARFLAAGLTAVLALLATPMAGFEAWADDEAPVADSATPQPETPQPETPKPEEEKPSHLHESLSDRAAREVKRIGKLVGKEKTLSRAEVRRAGLVRTTSVVWRKTKKKAILIEVTPRGGEPTTYLVKGAIAAHYRRAKGPAGRLGVPTEDPRCGLPDKGCLQTFTHETIYSRRGKVTSSSVKGIRGDIIAVARSQVGFTQKMDGANRVLTKYQRWAKTDLAWCSIFQLWVVDRAGHSGLLKKHKDFFRYRAWLREEVTSLKRPKVGAYVIMTGSAPYGHTALVVAVSKDRSLIKIIDGNWRRHVLERWTPVSSSMEFYWPYS